MEKRKASMRASAYTGWTDGSSALVVDRFRVEKNRRPPQPILRRKPAYRGLNVPIWVVCLSVAGALFAFSFTLLHMRANIAGAQKAAQSLQQELSHTQEIIDALEIEIGKKSNPERIHAVATNWLKMRIPQASEIRTLHDPMEGSRSLEFPVPPKENVGFFHQLLAVFGL